LSSLIEQQDDKKYYLSELGLHAYTSLIDNKDNIITPEFSKKEFNSPILKGLMLLTPKTYINYENKRTYSVMIFSILIVLIGSIFCGLNGLFPFFLFFGESLMIFTTVEAVIQFLLALFFIGNILLYFLINEGLSRIIYKKKENTLKFLVSFAIVFFPLDIYLVLRFILTSTGSLTFSYIRVLDNVLMILFQVWSLWLLTYNLSINKKLKIENSLIVSLLVHYSGFSIMLLISI
jgi:hypothetical protein